MFKPNFQRTDLLIGMIARIEVARDHILRASIVPAELAGCYASGEFPIFVPDSQSFEPRWFHWITKTKFFWRQCDEKSHGTSGKNRIRPERFLEIEIPLPPLEEQRRIVARIEELAAKVEAARELRQQAGEEARALKNSVLRSVFCDWLTKTPVSTIDEVCESIIDNLHSTPKYSDDGYPCVRSSDVEWGKLNLTNARRTPEYEYIRRIQRGTPEPGDIVLVREGGGTGKAALIETEEKFSLGQRVMMFRPDTTVVEPKFFLYQVLSPYVYDEQIASRIKGSASPHVNISATRQFRFRLPSLNEQRRIVAYLDALQAKIKAVEQHHAATAAALAALLPSILDRAFKGEL